MRLKLLSSILVSASMVAASPVIAAQSVQASAAKLSVAGARTGASQGSDKLNGGSGGLIAIALIAGIIAIGVLVAIDDSDDNNSVSR